MSPRAASTSFCFCVATYLRTSPSAAAGSVTARVAAPANWIKYVVVSRRRWRASECSNAVLTRATGEERDPTVSTCANTRSSLDRVRPRRMGRHSTDPGPSCAPAAVGPTWANTNVHATSLAIVRSADKRACVALNFEIRDRRGVHAQLQAEAQLYPRARLSASLRLARPVDNVRDRCICLSAKRRSPKLSDAAPLRRVWRGRRFPVGGPSLRPLRSLELVVLVVAPVLEVPDGEERRPEVPVVDDLVLDLAAEVGEQRRHHLLLERRDVLRDLAVQTNVSLPPLVEAWQTGTGTTRQRKEQRATRSASWNGPPRPRRRPSSQRSAAAAHVHRV